MGCANSTEDRELIAINQQVEKEIAASAKAKEVKLIILGIGGSGKSTVVKQLKIIHNFRFTEEELRNASDQILSYLKGSIKELIQNLKNTDLSTDENYIADLKILNEIEIPETGIDEKTIQAVSNIFQYECVKNFILNNPSLFISESCYYFLDNMDRITMAEYIPNEDDMLRVRVQTTGIIESTIEHKGASIKLCDVGGQRSERRKWVSCFEDITAVLYILALSDYDRYLVEDPNTNSMHESLKLLASLTNSQYLRNKPFLIFLNKADIFESKIQHVPLTKCFPEYTGKNDYNSCLDYIKQKAVEASSKFGEHCVYFHTTNATDKENIKFVFDVCGNIILRDNLLELGLG